MRPGCLVASSSLPPLPPLSQAPACPLAPACSLLRRRKAPEAAAAVGLQQRAGPHRIVPRRLFVPLDAPPGAPAYLGMPSQERYLHSRFAGATLFERYIEWVSAGSASGSGGL